MNTRFATSILAVVVVGVLAFSAPASLRDADDRGGFYLFSREFLEDIPKRLVGPGRFRFILQPLVAIMLGIRGGLTDAREGRPPYLSGMLFRRRARQTPPTAKNHAPAKLMLMAILLDAVFQWIILGACHPSAALVIGPVLIGCPYGIARSLANRLAVTRKDLH
jgi:hypothetical protein